MPYRSRHSRRGQSLVEFALALPLLTLLLLGAGDFARALSAYIEIGNMAREGAHYGSLNASTAADDPGIQSAALGEGGTIFGVSPTVEVARGTDGFEDGSHEPFQYVKVTVRYRFQPLFSLFGPLTLTRSAQMRVLPG